MRKTNVVQRTKKRSLLGQFLALPCTLLVRFITWVYTLFTSGFFKHLFFKRFMSTRQHSPGSQVLQVTDISPVDPHTPDTRETASRSLVLTKPIEPSAELQQLEERFLSMASHELKTPMTSISGHAQLMLRRLANLPENTTDLALIQLALQNIDWQTRRLNSLVDELLDLHTIKAGKIKFQLLDCDLADLCREAVEEQRLLANRAIAMELPSQPLTVRADCKRLNQVLVNLLRNAITYTPQEAPVTLRLNHYNQVAIVEVEDAGPGIPRDELLRIFEPFYRGPEIQETAKSGLGLGLAICKEIVERHGGRIWCSSTVGKGSLFTFTLPLPQAQG